MFETYCWIFCLAFERNSAIHPFIKIIYYINHFGFKLVILEIFCLIRIICEIIINQNEK